MKKRFRYKRYTASRIMMERVLGRELSENEVVHHKDGNSANNNIENLQVMTRGVHTSHHLRGLKRTVSFRRRVSDGNHNRKLSSSDVLTIRKMLTDGIKQYIIAYIYDISHKEVSHIKCRRVWAWLK